MGVHKTHTTPDSNSSSSHDALQRLLTTAPPLPSVPDTDSNGGGVLTGKSNPEEAREIAFSIAQISTLIDQFSATEESNIQSCREKELWESVAEIADTYCTNGGSEQAEQLYKIVIDGIVEKTGEHSLAASESAFQYGKFLCRQQDYAKAQRQFEQAIEIVEQNPPDNLGMSYKKIAQAHHGVAVAVVTDQDRLTPEQIATAHTALLRAEECYHHLSQYNESHLAALYTTHGSMLRLVGRDQAALQYIEKGLNLWNKMLLDNPEFSPQGYITNLQELKKIYVALGKVEVMETHYQRVLDSLTKDLPDKHEYTGKQYEILDYLYPEYALQQYQCGESIEAYTLYSEFLTLKGRVGSEITTVTPHDQLRLAQLAILTDQDSSCFTTPFSEAVDQIGFKAAVTFFEQEVDDTDPFDHTKPFPNGKDPEGQAFFWQRIIALAERDYVRLQGSKDESKERECEGARLIALNQLVRWYKGQEDHHGVVDTYDRIFNAQERLGISATPDQFSEKGHHLLQLKRYDEAKEPLQSAVAIAISFHQNSKGFPDPVFMQDVRLQLARIAIAQKECDEALKYLEQVEKTAKLYLDQDPVPVARVHMLRSVLYRNQGEKKAAMEEALSAVSIIAGNYNKLNEGEGDQFRIGYAVAVLSYRKSKEYGGEDLDKRIGLGAPYASQVSQRIEPNSGGEEDFSRWVRCALIEAELRILIQDEGEKKSERVTASSVLKEVLYSIKDKMSASKEADRDYIGEEYVDTLLELSRLFLELEDYEDFWESSSMALDELHIDDPDFEERGIERDRALALSIDVLKGLKGAIYDSRYDDTTEAVLDRKPSEPRMVAFQGYFEQLRRAMTQGDCSDRVRRQYNRFAHAVVELYMRSGDERLERRGAALNSSLSNEE